MSFSVALQSAIFYICACTPCAKARHHQKSKALAKKAQEEKARLHAEMPHLYHHPDPFNTNPYWSEEIMMGPSLPARGKSNSGSKNTSQRALNSANGPRDTRSLSESGGALTNPELSPTIVPSEGEPLDLKYSTSMSLSDDWNKKRYQREDEELWGEEISRTGNKLMDALKQAGSSAGRMLEARLGGKEPRPVTEEDRYRFYVKNPPVNEHHPPVVSSRPAHKDAMRWMLQPPPPAKVMEGKVPVSRSMSQASRLNTNGEEPPLGRLVHEKMVEAKIKKGELPTEGELANALSRPGSVRANTSLPRTGRSQRSTRSRSLSLDSSEASDEFRRHRRRSRARPPVTPDIDSSDDDEYGRSIESLRQSTRAAHRPKLPTIVSTQPEDKESPVSQPNPEPALKDVSNQQLVPDLSTTSIKDMANPEHQTAPTQPATETVQVAA